MKGMKKGMKKAMKAMRARKAMKRVSKIAKGKRAKATIFLGKGAKVKTVGGLTKSDLKKNTYGRIVSARASLAGRKRYAATIKGWIDSVKGARKALGLAGFVAVNGKTAQGKALYAKAKSFYSTEV